MSIQSQDQGNPVYTVQDIAALFEQGATEKGQERVGIEHERFFFDRATHAPAHYLPQGCNAGMGALYARIANQDGWIRHEEKGNLIRIEKDGASIGFEPGAQSEVSGAPFRTVHEIADETRRTIHLLNEHARTSGLRAVATAFQPEAKASALPLVPRQRYKMMSDYNDEIGSAQGHDMMRRTAGVQANLDYTRARFVPMLRTLVSLQPVFTALYANSIFKDGALSGYQSTRSHGNYNAMDDGVMGPRYGFMLPVAFEQGFDVERLARYYAEETTIMGYYDPDGVFRRPGKGVLLRDFMRAALPGNPGLQARAGNVADHINGVFSEVKAKVAPGSRKVQGIFEVRGPDAVPEEMIIALPAANVGLTYVDSALDEAYELVRGWSHEEREHLRATTPRLGLQTPFRGGTVQDIAKEMLGIAERGLIARGLGEEAYLQPLHEIAGTGRNWAVRLREEFEGAWKGDIRKLYTRMDYARAPSVLQQPALSG